MYHLISNQVKTPKRNQLISVLYLGVGVMTFCQEVTRFCKKSLPQFQLACLQDIDIPLFVTL